MNKSTIFAILGGVTVGIVIATKSKKTRAITEMACSWVSSKFKEGGNKISSLVSDKEEETPEESKDEFPEVK